MLADAHRRELGFVRRGSLERAAMSGSLWVAEQDGSVVGLAYVWHRRDGQTTLHAIAIEARYRLLYLGSALLQRIVQDARQRRQQVLVTKCPVGLPANAWYQARGFTLCAVEPGKARSLNVWSRPIGDNLPSNRSEE